MKRFSLVITLLLLLSEVPPQTQAVLLEAAPHVADGGGCIPWTPTTCPLFSWSEPSLRQHRTGPLVEDSLRRLRRPTTWPPQPRSLNG
jgi:hypothetical protein